ncbi:hypothetical protein LP414_27910 [Polaromonas sp. P1(28)-13]|nr:hypothetical protein LP414_27910 [Polaromonas sp. P1(28)-13]
MPTTLDDLVAKVDTLDTNTTALLAAVSVVRANAQGAASTATTKAGEAVVSAAAANASKGEAAGSAAQALAIYGTAGAMQVKLDTAAAQANAAAASASSAASVLQQDLSAISAALHRSPNAITAQFIYDTGKDSDGGAWTERMQHTSWFNEALNGTWRSQIGGAALLDAETTARAISGAATGDYFQYTGDGKFYKLNAGAGTTEVFRGNKAKFHDWQQLWPRHPASRFMT